MSILQFVNPSELYICVCICMYVCVRMHCGGGGQGGGSAENQPRASYMLDKYSTTEVYP